MTHAITNFRRTTLTLAALAACLAFGTAQAGDATGVRTAKVAYGDLNLTTERGANMLYARLTAAARTVCAADGVDGRNLQQFAATRSCVRQAVTTAVQDVHAREVATRFAAAH